MANLWRVVATWSGGKVGTGYTNMFFTAGVGTAVQASDAARAFMNSAYSSSGSTLPVGITISYPAAVDEIDATNGHLVSTTPVTQPAIITGSDAGVYAAVAGACVTWLTAGVVGGRRVRGRTFLVPMGAAGLQNDGTLSALATSSIPSAAATLISSAPEFAVWRRPSAPGATDGDSFPVVAGRLQDKTAFLSSRR